MIFDIVGGKELMTYRILNRRTAPLEQSHCLFRMTHSGRLPLALSTGETLPSLPSGGNFVGGFLMRNKRSPQCGVAPIEHTEHRFDSSKRPEFVSVKRNTGSDSATSIVDQSPWSGLCSLFQLTRSSRFLLRRIAHRATASFAPQGLQVTIERTEYRFEFCQIDT